MGYERLE